MKKKLLLIIMLLMLPLLMVGCSTNKKETKESKKNEITIVIQDNEKKELFNEKIETNREKLIDVLEKDVDVKLKYDTGEYGAYITSMMNIEQKNADGGMYYWAYYINDKYAEIGVSDCKIENGTEYKFVYEFYGN